MSENTNTASAGSSDNKQKTPFFKGVKAEFKKIIWPDKQTLFRQTVAVVVVSFITGLLIAIIDRLLQYGINFMIG